MWTLVSLSVNLKKSRTPEHGFAVRQQLTSGRTARPTRTVCLHIQSESECQCAASLYLMQLNKPPQIHTYFSVFQSTLKLHSSIYPPPPTLLINTLQFQRSIVQKPNGPRKESVFKPVCPALQDSGSSTRGQEVKEILTGGEMSRPGSSLPYLTYRLPPVCPRGRMGAADYFLCSLTTPCRVFLSLTEQPRTTP